MKPKHIMIIAGEASGDLHGSKLVRSICNKNNKIHFSGIGGQSLRDAGVEILVDASELSVVGITEVFSKIPNLFKAITIVKKHLKSFKPDLVILIDFPDFNLKIAAVAKKLGIPVLYYICPQVWAWRQGRIKIIRKFVNHVAVILPFEEDFYRKHKVPVTFVGHPLLDVYTQNGCHRFNALETKEKVDNENHGMPVIGLMPGSRDKEVIKHLPVMLDAAQILQDRLKNIKFIISIAPSVEKKHVEKILKNHKEISDYELATEGVKKVFEMCKMVVAASGTVTLESAIFGTPTVIIYKVSLLTYWIGRLMIKVKNVGLVNLIAEKNIAPELLQDNASPENIADFVFNMLNDTKELQKQRKKVVEIRNMLGGPGASERVAEIALNMMEKKN
ncbi:MAG: lipid-A-disaccharide synthase [Desulfobacteraceae bacterium]|nr:lipid-A-disaccharide synthase [Desulfobacteraceae bacterium]MBC2719939.1 lipid-A-disaccharide synthase [Desulfobacteraceae bacterium]